ncbi:MAG: hypothetical protein ACI9JN_001844 [Bacteroidia bacterium]|jgi:hypothetical protein
MSTRFIKYSLLCATWFAMSVTNTCHAQEINCAWAKQSLNGFESEYIQNMEVDNAGNVYIIGRYTGNFKLDTQFVQRWNSKVNGNFFIAKLRPSGELDWLNRIGGSQVKAMKINSISADSNGNVYCSGDALVDTTTSSLRIGDDFSIQAQRDSQISFLVKMDKTGKVTWAQDLMNLSQAKCQSLKVLATSNQQIYLSGYITGRTTFGNDILEPINKDAVFVAKADSGGQYLWSRVLGSKVINSQITEMATNTKGEVFLSGAWEGDTLFAQDSILINPTSGGFGNLDRFISNFSTTGDLNWLVREGGTKTDAPSILATMVDGSVYSVSNVYGSIKIDNDTKLVKGPTMLLSKYGPNGDYIFHKSLSNSSNLTDFKGREEALFISWTYDETNSKNGEFTLDNPGESDAGLAKLNLQGDVIWAHGFGGLIRDTISCIAISPTTDVLIAGHTASGEVLFGSKKITNTRGYYFDFFIASIGGTLGVLSQADRNVVTVYPNPSSEYVFITWPTIINVQIDISISDGLGREVTVPVSFENNGVQVDIKQLSAGIYFVQINTGSVRYTKKFIKE